MGTNAKIMTNEEALKKYTAEELTKFRVQICYNTMEGLTEEHMGSDNQWIEIDKAFPDNVRILFADNKTVGYWSFVCLKNDAFEKAKKGVLSEEHFNINLCEEMTKPGEYKGYFTSIAVLPEYRCFKNFRLLIEALIDQLVTYAEKGIFITEWTTNAFTKDGETLSKVLGMQKLRTGKTGGEIYYAPPGWHSKGFLKRYPKLAQAYSKMN